MITRELKKGITWIDIVNPTEKEIVQIKDEFLLSEEVAHNLKSPSLKPYIYKGEDYIYSVSQIPIQKRKSEVHFAEIDIVLSKRWFITVRYANDITSQYLEDIINKVLEKNANKNLSAEDLFSGIVKNFYDDAHVALDDIELSMEKIKNNLFQDKEKEIVRHLSKISFSLIDTYHALTFHKRIFIELNEWSNNIEFEALIGYKDKLEERVLFLQKKLRAYENTINIVLENKSAEAVKTLSMMSFIFFPLSFIAGIFSMNTVSTPIIGNAGDWYNIIYFIITVVIVMLGYFKYKRWL